MTMLDKVNGTPAGAEMASELVRQLRAELKANTGQWKRLARLAEGELTHAWIVAFANNTIVMPHVDKIFSLAKYLGVKITLSEAPHFNKFPS